MLATIPKDAIELQKIFRNIGFKGSRDKTHVYFDDCMFGMLTDKQLAHVDLSKSTKQLKWQELIIDL